MVSRRDFFKSITKPLQQSKEDNVPLLIRPPYGKSESLFQNECPSCDSLACITSCDEKIIFIDKETKTPTLTFAKNGCTFCDECAISCEKNVLSLDNLDNSSPYLNAIFQISIESCIAHQNVICYSCKEPCIDDAILFNGMFNPIIDNEKCSACGFCISRCPTKAISYRVIPQQEENKL